MPNKVVKKTPIAAAVSFAIASSGVFTNNFAKMNIEQTHVVGVFDFDTSFVENIDFGIQLTEVNNRSAGSVVQRDAWGGVTQPGAIADLLTPASAFDAFDQIPGGDDSRRQVDFSTFDMREVIARTEALMASGEATTFLLPDMGDCGTGLCTSSRFTSDRRTTEESLAAHIQVNMSAEWGLTTVEVRAGLRYEQTDISSQALSPAFTRIDWVAGNELSAVQGAPDFTSLEGSYDLLLPSFDLKIDLTDNLVGRVSYGSTLTRPNYGDIQGGQTINSRCVSTAARATAGIPTSCHSSRRTATFRSSTTTVATAMSPWGTSTRTSTTSSARHL
ncbi:MAG: TonB-dependent receptor [Pseudomonadales bacterium]|nr:TonB-dependent receptor [Pseudomonadales bacterium]